MVGGALRDSVPAIRESEAEGETAAIFADIRASLGASSVNLIWRHLATLPGVLPWAWSAIAPVHRSGAIVTLAADYRAALQLPALPELPDEVLAVLEVGPADRDAIGAVLRGYHFSCTMNILSLNALLLHLDGVVDRASPRAAGKRAAIEKGGRPPPMEKMAPLLDPADMSPEVARLAWRLNALGERGDGRILASLYRYLANWPRFLALSWALLAPLDRNGQLVAAIDRALEQADVRARGLCAELAPSPAAFDAPTKAAVRWALEAFGRGAIVKMTPIGGILLLATAQSEPPLNPV